MTNPDFSSDDLEGGSMKRLDAHSTVLQILSEERDKYRFMVDDLYRQLQECMATKSLALLLHDRMDEAYSRVIDERDNFQSFADRLAVSCADENLKREYSDFVFSLRSTNVGPV